MSFWDFFSIQTLKKFGKFKFLFAVKKKLFWTLLVWLVWDIQWSLFLGVVWWGGEPQQITGYDHVAMPSYNWVQTPEHHNASRTSKPANHNSNLKTLEEISIISTFHDHPIVFFQTQVGLLHSPWKQYQPHWFCLLFFLTVPCALRQIAL